MTNWNEATAVEKTTHTPGPWTTRIRTCDTVDGSIAYIKADSDHKEIAVLYSDEEQVANAALIAAAPDLLAALKKAAHVFRRCELDPVDNNYTSILEQAEMAIAKAEGR